MKKPIPFGKYFLLERINVGGMAEVFRAKAYGVEGFERLVAVKRILPNIAEDKEFIKMFIDEAKIAVQLNHANIAQIFDLGMVDASYYIALEHVHGRDLRAIFDRCRNVSDPMPIAQACFVVMKVCEGLDYAHNKRDQSGRELNLVHRDVSPQNILVSFEGEVKLIDFGIAKAAGKGSKTQAGILKGKFGYMSPEQVRGLPIDRRSDIFSCGIVLYELLTGERLFVGESDFSTLEKVRNVEILPPSTYNRKIPEELERIVLKALAKDHEDRYQNAIDLHDELQAFVYTAGEFYSRKDLAAWMKRTFAKEIEDETAKLEAYRRLRPPEQRAPTRPPTGPGGRRSTLALPSVAPPAPPPPPPIPAGGNGRRTADLHRTPAPMAASAAPGALPPGGPPSDLEWDDDELETQIYDNADHNLEGPDPAAPGAHGGAAPMGAGGNLAAASGGSGEPDLSSLVQTARGWDAGPGAAPPRPARPGAPPSDVMDPPPNLANGSNQTPSPFHAAAPVPASGPPVRHESTAVERLVGMAEPIFDSGQAQAMHPTRPRSRAGLYLGIAAAILLVGGGVAAAIVIAGGDDEASAANSSGDDGEDGDEAGSDTAPSASLAGDGAEDAETAVNLPKEVLKETGFDLIVSPSDATVKLDGKKVDLPPPISIRNLKPGEHTLKIEGPPGFFSKTETIVVEAGKAEKIEIELDALEITARFNSVPPGANVTLVSGGKRTSLGPTPANEKLDPRKKYEVVFEKKGYVTVTKPITLSGRSEETVTEVLERAGRTNYVARGNRDRDTDRGGGGPGAAIALTNSDKGGDQVKRDDPPKRDDPKPPVVKEKGTLLVGTKPIGFKIYVDGRNTGQKTPTRNLELTVGRHKVTLIHNEHNIKETFVVNVKPGMNRVIKDLSSRIK